MPDYFSSFSCSYLWITKFSAFFTTSFIYPFFSIIHHHSLISSSCCNTAELASLAHSDLNSMKHLVNFLMHRSPQLTSTMTPHQRKGVQIQWWSITGWRSRPSCFFPSQHVQPPFPPPLTLSCTQSFLWRSWFLLPLPGACVRLFVSSL